MIGTSVMNELLHFPSDSSLVASLFLIYMLFQVIMKALMQAPRVFLVLNFELSRFLL